MAAGRPGRGAAVLSVREEWIHESAESAMGLVHHDGTYGSRYFLSFPSRHGGPVSGNYCGEPDHW